MMEDLPFFCGWGWDFSLSLEKEFEGAGGVILRLISSKLRNLSRLHDAQMCLVFPFKYRSMALCMILMDSSWLVSLFLFVLYTQDLIKFLGRRLFLDGGIGTSAIFGGRSFTHYLWSESKYYVCLFTATELRSCIASFETTGNLATCTFLRWLWIFCCVVFVCLCFAGLGIIRILRRCRRKNAKTFLKMDTECWKLLVK